MNEKEYIESLEKKIEQGVKVEELEGHPQWEPLREILETEASRLMSDIASDKYVNDHNGYLSALGELKAVRRLFTALNLRKSQAQDAKEKKEQFKRDKS